jgi:molybdopterin converting factor small subunit
MTVTVHVFASLREQVGRASWTETLPPGCTTDGLMEVLINKESAIAALHSIIRVAVNDRWVKDAVALSDNDDVALLTPVSGG